jgi:hypothetical protein
VVMMPRVPVPTSRRRVLILRTSRFVGMAVACARAAWPTAEVRVLYQSGAEAELRSAGIDPDIRFALPRGSRITLTSLLTSRWGWRLLWWRPDEILVQWWNPVGDGHQAVDRAALMLQPRGFHVVQNDGTRIWMPVGRRLARPFRALGRRLASVLIVVAIAGTSAALWPMAVWLAGRERRRLAERR